MSNRTFALRSVFALALAATPLAAAGCGGSDDGSSSPPGTSTGGSTTGQGGGQSTGGKSSAGGANPGTGGQSAGGAPAGGHAGTGAAAQGGSAGASGHATGGSSGSGGSGGSGGKAVGGGGGTTGGSAGASAGGVGGSQGGSGGSSGSPAAGGASTGGSGGCVKDADCAATAPPTAPPKCATGVCNQGACFYHSIDADKDGHGTAKCKTLDGSLITLGDDCNDTDPDTFAGAWDGPKGDGNPDRCDGVDQDCDGTADDSTLKNGTTCTCAPGDVRNCSQDSGGKPITWPTGSPVGACVYGAQTCEKAGTWGPCTGAVAPSLELCNHVDDDCNGAVDDGPPPDNVPNDAVYFVYDGDNDLHAGAQNLGYAPVRACIFNTPSTAPTACTSQALPCGIAGATTVDECCPAKGWKLSSGVPQDDCDDRDPSIFPGATEQCMGKDNSCSGTPDKGCQCQVNATLPCSATAGGTPILWPTGSPHGTCQYGTQTCGATGQYGACLGAIAPAGTDNCAVPGNDDDCSGVANDSCVCIDVASDPSYSTPCSAKADGTVINWPAGTPVGACQYGTALCQATGQYGQCNGAIGPAPADLCNVPGDDSNCNGIPNEGCSCVDQVNDPTYQTNCSALSSGMPIVWPTGTPAGACKYGTAQCQPNGQYGQCNGAIAPAGADSCTSKGDDSNCNGSPNDGCACLDIPSDPTYTGNCSALPNGATITWPKGVPVGSCKYGTAQCQSTGQYGQCNGAIAPAAKDSCSSGNDDNCNGIPNEGCPCINGATQACGSTIGACKAGTQTCNGGAWGACSGGVTPSTETCNGKDDDCNGTIDDGIANNGPCTTGVGKCRNPGQLVCNSSTAGTYKCNAVAGSPDSTPRDTAWLDGTGAATWDGNCSGTITVSTGWNGSTIYAGGGCGNTASYAYLCNINNDAPSCASAANLALLVCGDISGMSTGGDCGVFEDQVVCAWNASTQTCSLSTLKHYPTQGYVKCD